MIQPRMIQIMESSVITLVDKPMITLALSKTSDNVHYGILERTLVRYPLGGVKPKDLNPSRCACPFGKNKKEGVNGKS